jgi:Tol biopolymer transport system component
MHEEPPNQDSSNLFESVLNSSTGTFEGPPTRITSGEGTISQPSITSDGKRLAFDVVLYEMATGSLPFRGDTSDSQSDVYVSEFSAKRAKASTPRRLTLDDADDIPYDWTADSRAIIFISNRTGKRNIFRQRIDETSAEMLTLGIDGKDLCRVSPDGAQVLYLTSTPGKDTAKTTCVMRAPLIGVAPRAVLAAPGIAKIEF